MADYFVVEMERGPAWANDRPRRQQAEWDTHAEFMDALVEAGFVVAGGPIADVDGDKALLVVNADSEADAQARLAADPWMDGVLIIKSIRPWTIWLGRVSGSG